MATKRRGRGEGTIRQRTPRRWEARYTGSDGRQHSLYAPTRAAVQTKLAAAHRAVEQGRFITGPDQTTAQFLTHWLDAVASQRLRPRTIERYAGIVRLHIIPSIGSVTLTKLTPQHIERLYTSKRDTLSPAGIRYIHQVLHAALGHALRMQLIARNPAAGVAPPKPKDREMLYFDPTQARMFLELVRDEPLEPLYTLAITTGMRLGELLGLRWQAVDLDAGTLQVRVSLARAGGTWALAEPKTPRSRRLISLSATAIAALRRQRSRQLEARLLAGDAWTHLDLVFANPFGEPLDGSRITERRLRPLLKAAGLPMIRFHDLRHTAATLMLSAGVNPKIVSELLGHTSVAITLDRYSHVIPTMQEDAARRMDAMLGNGA